MSCACFFVEEKDGEGELCADCFLWCGVAWGVVGKMRLVFLLFGIVWRKLMFLGVETSS